MTGYIRSGGYTIVDSYDTKTRALGLCRGVYQRALLAGAEAWSGATLRGRASQYGIRYARSRSNLVRYLRRAGFLVGWRVGDYGRREIVIEAPTK